VAHAELLSSLGEAAIAVVRVVGADPAALLGQIGLTAMPRADVPVLRTLTLADGTRERALVLTTDAGVELHIHGNPLLTRRLLDALGGDRHTSRRGSCDAAPQGYGGLRAEVLARAASAPTRLGLLHALAQLAPGGLLELLTTPAALSAARVWAAVECGDRLVRLWNPLRVVLRGPTNAGKSTLFNLPVGRERVRTGPSAALTRDPIEELIEIDGWPVHLVDTAGEPCGEVGSLDAAAVEAGRVVAGAADVVVWVTRATGVVEGPAAEPTLRVLTHADLVPSLQTPLPAFDLTRDRSATRAAIGRLLLERARCTEPDLEAAFVHPRQRPLLMSLAQALDRRDPGEAERSLHRLGICHHLETGG